MPAIRNLPYKRCEWRSPKCKQTWTKWLCTARRRAYCVCQQFKHGRTRKHNSLSLYTRWQRPCAGADLYHCSIIHSKIRSTSVENRACTAVKLNQEKSVLSCVHNLVSLAVYCKRSVPVFTYVCMSKTVHALHLHAALDSREKSRRVSLAPQSASGPCSGVHRGVRSTTP